MFYAYSTDALKQNWLNPAIIQVIQEGMSAIDAGRSPSNWLTYVPAALQAKLKSRFGFRLKLRAIWQAYGNLTSPERSLIRDAISQQTSLPELLANDGPCTANAALPSEIVKPVKVLFDYMFSLLTEIKEDDKCLRDTHYATLYYAAPDRICPYCAIGRLRAPKAPRHALDHFLPIARYPFVGADFRNLSPTCTECNSDFKGTADVLFDDQGQRRRCSDPYAGPIYNIRLSSSELFEGNEHRGRKLPRWKIELIGGPTKQAETWDAIYKVRDRYSRDVLDAEFFSWVDEYAGWFVRIVGRGRNADEVAAELPKYVEIVSLGGLSGLAFVKAEVFRLIHATCVCPKRGRETREWLWNFVEYAV